MQILNTPEKEMKNEKFQTIKMIKDGSSHASILILETEDKKLTFNLKNEKEFLNQKKINCNLSVMTNKKSNITNKLANYIEILQVEEKKEENVVDMKIVSKDEIEGDSSKNNKLIICPKEHTNTDTDDGNIKNKNKFRYNNNLNESNHEDYFTLDKKIENIYKINENLMIDLIPETHSTVIEKQIPHKVSNIQVTPKINSKNLRESELNLIHVPNKDEIKKQRGSISTPKKKLVVIEKGTNKIQLVTVESENHDSSMEVSEFPLKICLICDQFFLKDKVFNADDCQHYFCRRCGKSFFEEKIEEGEKNFKCPVYKCAKKLKIEILKSLVSEKHFIIIENGKTSSKQNNYIEIYKIDSLKFYSQKHVIDINTNESFFIFNKAKEQICVKCSEPALYGKTGKYMVKCLNCYHTICKFCMKDFTSNHFEITSLNYCKVYYRKILRKANRSNKSFCKNYCFNLLTIFVSYLLLLFCTLKIISIGIKNIIGNGNKSSIYNSCFYFFILSIIYLIILPLMLLFIPYFPALITLIG